MSIFTEKSVEIEVVSGGWILTWHDETKEDDFASVTSYPRPKIKTRGREIITTQKKLIERVKALT